MGNEAHSFNPEESEELKLQVEAEKETPKQIKTKLGVPSAKTVDVVQAEEADLGPREKLFRATEKSKKAEQYRDYVGKSYGEETKKDKPIFQIAERLVEKEAERKAAAIKELKAKILREMGESDAKISKNKQDPNDRFQRIRVTPELEAVQKKAAQRDIENANAKLTKAEENFAEAEKNRPGAFSRFFSRFKIGKQPEAVIAYQQAFQDKNVSPEELKKLEAAAVEAATSKTSAAEMTYQQAVRAVSEAKNQLEETKRSILNSGIFMERKKRTPGAEENKPIRVGDGRGISVRGIVQKEKPKVEEKKPEKPIARKPAPAIISGEHKIVFKEEPAQAQRKVEVNVRPEKEFEPVVVSEAEEQLENYIKGMIFKKDNTKQLIFQNDALMDRLINADFQSKTKTLKNIFNKAIMGAKNEMLKTHKLEDEESYELGTAKFEDLKEGTTLGKKLIKIFKQPKYDQFLALADFYDSNQSAFARPLRQPARQAPPVSRNW